MAESESIDVRLARLEERISAMQDYHFVDRFIAILAIVVSVVVGLVLFFKH